MTTENQMYSRIISAKHSVERVYAGSGRPSSEDSRMIGLGIAVAAGIFDQTVATALRKLAEVKLGIDYSRPHWLRTAFVMQY
jgi:hypothetical protein